MIESVPPMVRAQCEALLLEQVMSPMEASLGEFGEIVIDACCASIAERLQK